MLDPNRRVELAGELYKAMERVWDRGLLSFATPRSLGFSVLRKDDFLAFASRLYDDAPGDVRFAFVVLAGEQGEDDATVFTLSDFFFGGRVVSHYLLGALSYYVNQALSFFLSHAFPEKVGCYSCPYLWDCAHMSTFLSIHGLAAGVQLATLRRSGGELDSHVDALPYVLEYLRYRRGVLDKYIGFVESILKGLGRGENREGTDQR